MISATDWLRKAVAAKRWSITSRGIAACVAAALFASPTFAQELSSHAKHQVQEPAAPTQNERSGQAGQKDSSAVGEHQDASHPPSSALTPGDQTSEMEMGSMQGGRAPPDARDPYAYSDGFQYSGMPGRETSDEIVFGWLSADELEFLSGNEGDGFAWNVQANYGDDDNKLWLRTQGLKVPDELDPTTSGEVLWWRPYSPFWATQLGIRQDFGVGAHTYLAFGIEGLAPYWFIIEATGYVGDDGRLSARFKLSYDLRLTNRLILTPNVEANAYSEAEEERNLGSGLGNIEWGLRLRFEVHRKFAPYLGYVWERSFSGTADRRQAEGEPVNEHRFVSGFRIWF